MFGYSMLQRERTSKNMLDSIEKLRGTIQNSCHARADKKSRGHLAAGLRFLGVCAEKVPCSVELKFFSRPCFFCVVLY